MCDDFSSTLVTTVSCDLGRFCSPDSFLELHDFCCMLFTKLTLFYMLCRWLFFIFLFCKKKNNFYFFYFFFSLLNNKALIFEFEWRKFTSLWVQELHQAVTLILYPWLTQNRLCLTILFISTSRKKKNPSLWCCLVYCLMYSSLLILQTRCFFFQWKVLTGEIFKVVLKANKPFFKECHGVFMCCWFGVLPTVGKRNLMC